MDEQTTDNTTAATTGRRRRATARRSAERGKGGARRLSTHARPHMAADTGRGVRTPDAGLNVRQQASWLKNFRNTAAFGRRHLGITAKQLRQALPAGR